MIDIHCHILHGMDDGPNDLEAAVQLGKIAFENGITAIIATPHLTDLSRTDDFLRLREHRLLTLNRAFERERIDVELYPGAELFLNDKIFSYPVSKELALNGSSYLLVEFAMHSRNFDFVKSCFEKIFENGFIPILAHPERYTMFQRNLGLLNYLTGMGALLQVNMSSLAADPSSAEFKTARRLASNHEAAFFATDAHHPVFRPNDVLELLRWFPPDLDNDYFEKATALFPGFVLKNKPIDNSTL